MTEPLTKGYCYGTHRLVPPEETLARITPLLRAAGVTRCADITGLDRLGIPVYCAIRPQSKDLQVANGKGLRDVDAKVSALMEAIELFHAGNPAGGFRRASLASLLREGVRALHPAALPDFLRENYFSHDYLIDWAEGEDLLSGERVWLPASTAYLYSPTLYSFSSNGLASGNQLVEATLHALYELIERDTISRLSAGGAMRFPPHTCQFIDTETVGDECVAGLNGKISAAGVKLVLIRVRGCVPVHTFMAVLLDRNPFSNSSTVNVGYGTHVSSSVAATRAITEAAQSRLTYIHGARDDLKSRAYAQDHQAVYEAFDGIRARSRWGVWEEPGSGDLAQDYEYTLGHLARAGYGEVYRVNLTREDFAVPVVKVFVPKLEVIFGLF